MKYFLLPALLVLITSACQEAPKKEASPEAATAAPRDLLDSLAAAHGFGQWQKVNEIRFTFNVDRDTSHFERSWIWAPKTNRVTRILNGDTLTYLRSEVDSTLMGADGSFINDKYWFLAPYQWVWDRNSFTHTFSRQVPAPISGVPMDKLTIVYGAEGGYTPGDAYDFFIGKDSLVAEWVFRRGNQPEPSLAATWEEYLEMMGLKLASMHKNAEGNFKLYFTGIEVH
jgi:hypothetical protein